MKTFILVISVFFIFACSKGETDSSYKKEGVEKVDIDLQWGGYYASKEEGDDQYGVFRLIDFNRHSYHVAIFSEKFSGVPSLKKVLKLSPYIGHAPIDSRALLRNRDIHLLGGPPLTEKDLEGYRLYLEHFETSEDDIKKLFRDIIAFGSQPPLKLALEEVNGELVIEKR